MRPGRKLVVTGGAGGIGSELISLAQNEGYHTSSLDLAESTGADDSMVVDLTREDQIKAAFTRVGEFDVLVCIAGINARGRVEDLSWTDWRRVMDVNVRGTMLSMKHAAPLLRNGGAIVLTGSVSAHIGTDGYVAYHASKGAILGLMRAASGEFVSRGIRVNAVSPGWVDTPFTDRALAESGGGEPARARAIEAHLLGRMAEPREIAEAMIFLAGENSSFMTGAELIVDGGLLRKR